MRIIVALFLTFVMLMQTFSKTIIVTAFVVNRDYIAKNLCENRSHPEMHCCGKCHLRKQLQKDDEQQNASRIPQQSKNFDELVLIDNVKTAFDFSSFFSSTILFSVPADFISSPVRDDIFHPPSVFA